MRNELYLILAWTTGFLIAWFFISFPSTCVPCIEITRDITPSKLNTTNTTTKVEIRGVTYEYLEEGEDRRDMDEGSVTIVTAWFFLQKSKHPAIEYERWAKNLCKLNTNIYFWADSYTAPVIYQYRERWGLLNKTIINITTPEALSSFLGPVDWNRQSRLDGEESIHSIGLYQIWSSKVYMLAKVSIWNPFKTDSFYFFDVGYFRETDRYQNWPSKQVVKSLPRDRVVFLSINDFRYEEYTRFVKYFTNWNGDRLGGGAFGGTRSSILHYYKFYYRMVKEYDKHDVMWGKEQNVINAVAMEHPASIFLVKAEDGCGNKWFYMSPFLADPVELPSNCAVSHLWGTWR